MRMIAKRKEKMIYGDVYYFIGNGRYLGENVQVYMRRPSFDNAWLWSYESVMILTQNCRGFVASISLSALVSAKQCAQINFVCDIKTLLKYHRIIKYYERKANLVEVSDNYMYYDIMYNIIPSYVTKIVQMVQYKPESEKEILSYHQDQMRNNIAKRIQAYVDELNYKSRYNENCFKVKENLKKIKHRTFYFFYILH